ncbi:carotenoid biosynthesis protein [Methanobacterium alcaliphilum]|nr:carotenoid biosynthesis protein [Methanobacterium alcaliphilum]
MFIGCFYLATLQSVNKLKIIIISTFLVLMADFILDPAAVALKFWIFDSPGIFYGVPLMNLMGWVLTGFIASLLGLYLINEHIWDEDKPEILASSLFLILIFWTSVCIFLGLLIPSIIGLSFLIFILYKKQFKIFKFIS